jgi:hypothetical protein
MQLDNLNAYAQSALEALDEADYPEVRLNLAKILGATDILLDQATVWQRAQELYQSGYTPKQIASKTGLAPAAIRAKAYKAQWPSLKRVNKAKKAAVKTKWGLDKMQIVKTCRECHEIFVTTSGRGETCNRCQAVDIAIKNGLAD